MKNRHRMPKTKAEFEEKLMGAFKAGCAFGYGIEHTVSLLEQENIGAEFYAGRINEEEYNKRLLDIRGY